MTGYIVWGSILLLLGVILCSPVILSVRLGDENIIFVRYLFLKIPIFPKKEKTAAQLEKVAAKKEAKKLAKQKKKEQAKTEEEKEKEKKKARMTVSEILELVGELAEAASPIFKLFRHIYLVNLDLRVEVGGEDAAAIAIHTGRIEAAVGYFIALFRQAGQLKRLRHAIIRPNFLSEKTEYRVRFCIMIRPGTVLWAVFAAAFRFIGIKIRDILQKEPDISTKPMKSK